MNLGSDKFASLIKLAIEHKKSGIQRLGLKRLAKVTITNEGNSTKVKPNCWIEKIMWREINDILKLNGFAWLSNGRDSCWLKMNA